MSSQPTCAILRRISQTFPRRARARADLPMASVLADAEMARVLKTTPLRMALDSSGARDRPLET